MARMTLVIANKTYSSWSLRPWLAMRMAGLDFDEIVVPLDQPDTKARILEHCPAGKVPILKDGEAVVWESLAILEYVAEIAPKARLWPQDADARAHARAISAEMHAGFAGLRGHYPMNLRRDIAGRAPTPQARTDIERIVSIWSDARGFFPADGPFLFGHFTAADAMFAPVVTRFQTYGIAVDACTRAYMDAVLSLAPMRDWYAAARAETWVAPSDEV